MKNNRFTVYYLNDIVQDFYTISVEKAYCLAVTDATLKSRDSRIKWIYDEDNNVQYSDFELKYTIEQPTTIIGTSDSF